MSYFDSAYIAKFYLDEPESEAVRRLAESLGQVRCAQIGHVEVAAVFHRKLREGAFDAGAFRELTAQFDDDCGQGLWTWLPLTSALVQRAAMAFTHLPRPVFLRAADALHSDLCAGARSPGDLHERSPHVIGGATLPVKSQDRRARVEDGERGPG